MTRQERDFRRKEKYFFLASWAKGPQFSFCTGTWKLRSWPWWAVIYGQKCPPTYLPTPQQKLWGAWPEGPQVHSAPRAENCSGGDLTPVKMLRLQLCGWNPDWLFPDGPGRRQPRIMSPSFWGWAKHRQEGPSLAALPWIRGGQQKTSAHKWFDWVCFDNKLKPDRSWVGRGERMQREKPWTLQEKIFSFILVAPEMSCRERASWGDGAAWWEAPWAECQALSTPAHLCCRPAGPPRAVVSALLSLCSHPSEISVTQNLSVC